MSYDGCRDISCVNQDALHNKGPRVLSESGERMQIHGRRGWWFPAHANNFSTRSRTKADINRIVIHTAEGYTGGLKTFQEPDRGGSAHYAVQWDGQVAQMVDDKDIAWHAGNWSYNADSIGIEHVGFAHAMEPRRSGSPIAWSQKMLNSSAWLTAKLAKKYKVPLDREHIIGHVEVPSQTHSDPGDNWPWAWYMARVRYYYYRPWIWGGLALLMLGVFGKQVHTRKKRRIQSWEAY